MALPYSQTFGTNAAAWPSPFAVTAINGATVSQATVAGGRGVLAIPGASYPELGWRLPESMVNGTVRVDTVHVSATEQYDRIVVRGQGSWTAPTPPTGYVVEWYPNGGTWFCKLTRRLNGTGTDLVGGTSTGLATTLLSLSHRLEMDGATVRYRIWQTGQAEPGTWTFTHTDSSPVSGAGEVGGLAIGGASAVAGKQVEWDNLTVTTTDSAGGGTAGTNLLTNPGAETNTTGVSAGNGTVARITSPVRTGAGAFRLTATAAGNSNLLHAEVTQAMGLVPGQAVSISAWARAVTAVRNIALLVDWYGTAGYVSTSGVGGSSNALGQWIQITGTPTMPANANRGALYAQAQGCAAGEQHDFDDFSMSTTTAPPAPGAADGTTRIGGVLVATKTRYRLGGVLLP